MNILDNTALDYMMKQGGRPSGFCCISPDIVDEYETSYEQRLPGNVRNIFDLENFDKAIYLRNYQTMLNKHGGRSFYNMTGFGDISILALLKTQEELAASMLPLDELVVVTDDGPLRRRIRREFGESVKLITPKEFFQ